MKLIDVLIKIAKGEDYPKLFRCKETIYCLNKNNFKDLILVVKDLNEEIEVLDVGDSEYLMNCNHKVIKHD